MGSISETTDLGCILFAVTSDADLLYAWREGDKRAGKRLVERYYGTVTRFFDNKVMQDRDDLVQETFKACVEGRDRIKDPSRFEAYLFRSAYNILKRYIRRKYDTPEQELSSRSMQELAPGPSTMLLELEQKRRLLLALRELPVEMQTALELKYWEHLSSAEIAAVLGVTASTVRSYLRRGRISLHKTLGDDSLPHDDEPDEA